jgi:hypothetical protein
LTRAIDPAALTDLERLLAASVSIPTAGELRSARLGLVADLVAAGTGEIPGVADYLAARRQRAATGETWPAPSTLLAAFGDWVTVVRAAMRLSRGEVRNVPHTHRNRREASPPYTRAEVIAALGRFRAWKGDWPEGAFEWERWAAEVRRLAREGGKPDPRLPGQATIKKLFGSFGHALGAAERSGG